MLGALFLGLLQGLTEFLPVSSSGHLVLFQQFFDIGDDEVLFDLVLHLGTLVPILWFYRRDVGGIARDAVSGEAPFLQRDGVRLLLFIAVASVPTALIGLLFEDLFEALFARPAVLVVTFSITGALLFASRRYLSGDIGLRQLGAKEALILGLAQGLAITPGISRSGTTISVALMLGLNRELAARFSFLMSVPAILGAVVLRGRDVDLAGLDWAMLGTGGLAAMVSGYAALVLLVGLVKRGHLSRFAWYCWFAAAAAGGVALWVALHA